MMFRRLFARWAKTEEHLIEDSQVVSVEAGDPVREPLAVSELNLYPGYDAADLDILRKFTSDEGYVSSELIVDGFGRVSKVASLPNVVLPLTLKRTFLNWPVPDDGYMSEAAEYVATAIAVDAAHETFRMAELGAGWGPWTTLSAAMCRRKGISSALFVACEAMPSRVLLLSDNIKANNLTLVEDLVMHPNSYGVYIRPGAISDRIEVVQFPEAPQDMGAAIGLRGTVDYRGIEQHYVDVQCAPLDHVLGDYIYDFIHMDIQGMEVDALRHCSQFLTHNVKSIFIGTHSRKIEGDLMEFMYGIGFTLRLEKPCRMALATPAPTLMARTTHDGSQFWVKL